MKSLLFCFILLLHFNARSQYEKGRVSYGIHLNNSKLSDVDEMGKRVLSGILDVAKELKFLLEFDSYQSYFQLAPALNNPKGSLDYMMAKSIFNGEKIYYFNSNQNVLEEQTSFLGETFRIWSKIDKANWVLSSEKKIIQNFVCHKAIGTRRTKDKNLNPVENQIIAWYCPEISKPFGPFEAVGLPGLVLELELKAHSVMVEKIEFLQDLKINKLTKGKKLNREDFNYLIEQSIQN